MSTFLTAGPDLLALAYITRNLRERDQAECFACYVDTPDDLAAQTAAQGVFQWVAWANDRPVASIGARNLWPGVWSVWAFGTDEWPSVVLLLTRHVRRAMIPALVRAGAHRVHCDALATHEDARRWLTALGAREEGVRRGLGRNGEDFVTYAWSRDDVPCPPG
jgi:hypothetical protein